MWREKHAEIMTRFYKPIGYIKGKYFGSFYPLPKLTALSNLNAKKCPFGCSTFVNFLAFSMSVEQTSY